MFCFQPALEQQWAIKAFQQAETYFKVESIARDQGGDERFAFLVQLLSSLDASKLKLTQQDDQIYSRFRELFPELKVDQLNEDELKSNEGKAVIRSCSYERVSMRVRRLEMALVLRGVQRNSRRLQFRNTDSCECQRRIQQ